VDSQPSNDIVEGITPKMFSTFKLPAYDGLSPITCSEPSVEVAVDKSPWLSLSLINRTKSAVFASSSSPPVTNKYKLAE
jgi:hypothetical protein